MTTDAPEKCEWTVVSAMSCNGDETIEVECKDTWKDFYYCQYEDFKFCPYCGKQIEAKS